MNAARSSFGTVIVGGGPAGMALLLAACRVGRLQALLESGLAVIEASPAVGDGRLGSYVISSDSTADTFLDCLRASDHPELRELLGHRLSLVVSERGDGAAPLVAVARLQRLVGAVLWRIVVNHPKCAIFTSHTASGAKRRADGTWATGFSRRGGAQRTIISRHLVIATGGHQPRERLAEESVAGVKLLARYGDKLMQSGEVLAKGGLRRLETVIAGVKQPRIAIIGGSTSAVSAAQLLLTGLPAGRLGPGALTLLHRRDMRVYYPSAEAALADGYTEFGPADLCPLTGRVFRLAGLRLESRELMMQARGIGGRPAEPRLRLHRLCEPDATAVDILDRAAVVIAALGYRPHGLRLQDETGGVIKLQAACGPRAALVDDQCRVLDDAGQAVAGVFGIGLAAGFVPQGRLGGEPSFKGQANGLWLWQTAVGALIIDAVLRRAAGSAAVVTLVPAPDPPVPAPVIAGTPAALQIALLRPAPPPLSEAGRALRQIEQSGVFSNFGPVNTAFEHELVQTLFDGTGYCTTVANATLGLMLAVREAMERCPRPGARYALMPSFTFAAAGHAAIWCGLTPLFCDISPHDWAADAGAEAALLARYGDEIAVMMPYATFGYDIDLARYKAASARHRIPVVVDAAASLGTKSRRGRGFGAGSQIPLVFSMHATKSFATGEGGVVYSADKALIGRLRQMSNFGFGAPRTATMPGLNAKLSEVGALQGRLRLHGYELLVARRQRLVNAYRQVLPELSFQPMPRTAQAHQFLPALLPPGFAASRDDIQAGMAARGIGIGRYFSPHLAEQSYFAATAATGALPVTADVAGRIISLPLYDGMSELEMYEVVAALKICLGQARPQAVPAAAGMMRPAAE